MSDLIITSYLEDGKLKVKIVKDSEELWLNLINKFKQQCGPKTKQTTIENWRTDNNCDFGERVLEHTTYWILKEKEQLTDAQARQELKNYDLYQRLKLVEHLF